MDINTIRAWLGNVSLSTTNIYAEIDLEMKARAVALCDAVEAKPGRPWKESKGLLSFLKSLRTREIMLQQLWLYPSTENEIRRRRNIIRCPTYARKRSTT